MKLTWDNITVGMRVRCVFGGTSSTWYGKLATIVGAHRFSDYYVRWDEGTPITILPYTNWGNLSSFETLELSSEEKDRVRREEHAMKYL